MIYEVTRRYDILETKYNNLQESIISNHQGEKTIMLSEWLHKNYYHPDMLTPSEFLEAHFNVSTEDVLRLEHCTFVELFERIVSNTDWIELHSPVVLVQGFRHEMYWKSSKTTEWEQMSKSNIISFLTHCKKIIFGSVYKYRQQHYEKIKKNEHFEKMIDLIMLKITDTNFSQKTLCNKLLSILKKYMYVHVPKNVIKK